ncbi:MAG: SCP2 sterol-binding domain-containing protein [Syntrophaceae bacterium]|nr:SCP2 sterol-binding domain-containing protein [Syntrophaceae bacterium]
MILSEQTFTISVNVKELLTEFIPKLAREYVQMRGAQEELKGTELRLTLDISGGIYSYTIKDGVNFEVKEGAIENPQVYVSFPLESMSKMADMKNIDMLIGLQKQLSRKKFDLLCDLKGTSVFRIKHSDDTTSEITATFNGTDKPRVVLRLSMEDANLISSGKDSPVNLFMSGRMKIEGDMAFAMKTQPLFTP